MAILESMRRITLTSDEDDSVFRIGGDEFCVLTASNNSAYADQIADKIRRMNHETFSYENQEIPLELYVTTASLRDCSCYDEVFAGLHYAIKKSKE